MIVLILTKKGFDNIKPHITADMYIWINANILSEEELTDIRICGADITNFTEVIDSNNKAEIDCAIDTIIEHHPDETVWCEV